MAQTWAKKFYNSKAWRQCRDAFIARRVAADGGMCQDCGEQLGTIVHHWPVMLNAANVGDAAVALSHANLRWVCHDCHDRYPGHGVAASITPRIEFDADGEPIPPSEKIF